MFQEEDYLWLPGIEKNVLLTIIPHILKHNAGVFF